MSGIAAAEKRETGGCPACKGIGRTDYSEGNPDGLACLSCGGTGNRWHALLHRAYMAGWADGIEAMRNALPQSPEDRYRRMSQSPNHLIERLLNDDFAGD